MSDSICKFMSEKNYVGNMHVVNFVYEAELKTLIQPFIRPIYYIHLVTNGTGLLKMCDTEYSLKSGDLFFGFPACPYELSVSENFRYIYISFFGADVNKIFENFKISFENPVYSGFDNLMEFWLSSISRVKEHNANMIAESVLLYTLSFLGDDAGSENSINAETLYDMIVDYIDNHYRDKDISLNKIATVFSYTEKYISHLFKKNMKIPFTGYINLLRMKYACELMDKNIYTITEIASLCGYRDSLYFSKVFKKNFEISPSEYIKKNTASK